MQFKDIYANSPAELFHIGKKIQQLIIGLHPQIKETCHGGTKVRMASYSIGRLDNVVAVAGPGNDHCKLFLHHCDNIDSKGIKLEGKGKHAKHVKLYAPEDFDEQRYRLVIRQVVDIALTKS